jgi:hypothetical protein
MKQVFIVLAVVMVIVISGMGFSTGKTNDQPKPVKRNCAGYMVIEANKGVDCNGDTIKLVKRNGFYEIASPEITAALK